MDILQALRRFSVYPKERIVAPFHHTKHVFLGESTLLAYELAIDCSENDPGALRVIDETSRAFSWFITNLVDLFNPDSVFIGGNIDMILPYLLPKRKEKVGDLSVLMKLRKVPINPASVANLIVIRNTAGGQS